MTGDAKMTDAQRQYQKEYRAAHKEEIAAKSHERYLAKLAANPDLNKEKYQRYRDKEIEQARTYRQTHKETVRAKDRERYQEHKEERNASSKRHYADHRQEYIDMAEKWHREHPEKANGYYRKYHTGCSPELFQAFNEKQGGKCAICGGVNDRGHALCADHDHETGIIRGLLCRTCNLGIGHLRDDPTLMRKAAEYIDSFR
jgi:hypothetical protein